MKGAISNFAMCLIHIIYNEPIIVSAIKKLKSKGELAENRAIPINILMSPLPNLKRNNSIKYRKKMAILISTNG